MRVSVSACAYISRRSGHQTNIIHACLHALEVAWGRGFVAHDLGVPARTLVRLPEVATHWVRSLHLIREKSHMIRVPFGIEILCCLPYIIMVNIVG